MAGQSNALAVVTDLKHLNIWQTLMKQMSTVSNRTMADVMVESSPGKVFRGVVESVAEQGK